MNLLVKPEKVLARFALGGNWPTTGENFSGSTLERFFPRVRPKSFPQVGVDFYAFVMSATGNCEISGAQEWDGYSADQAKHRQEKHAFRSPAE